MLKLVKIPSELATIDWDRVGVEYMYIPLVSSSRKVRWRRGNL